MYTWKCLAKAFGHLRTEAVQMEVMLVAVLGQPLVRRLGGAPSHRHETFADSAV
jgi:hypothetical protein